MKKLIYRASLLCIIHIQASQSPISSTLTPSIPHNFTILHSQPLPEKNPLSQQEKVDCFFYILVSGLTPSKEEKTKKDVGRLAAKEELYKTFSNVTKQSQGPLIPKDFIKTGVPLSNTIPTHTLHFGWNDTGGKNNLTDAALTFSKTLSRLHQNYKKSYTCYYLIVTEGRSGLLVNYVTQHLLKKESFSLSVVVEIGTPLPNEKGNGEFYPNLFKIGTFYSLYTQHAYKLTTPVHFPPAPETSYSLAFINKHSNLYNVRLLLNNNQRSLQNIFEGKDLKQPLVYLGQHIFEYCNLIKRTHPHHHDLWATLDTRTKSKPFIGIVSHPAEEKSTSKAIKKEHLSAGKQLDEFQKKIGASTRINMSDRAKLQSKVRPIAHLRKSQKFAYQTA
jgi:hypothetical protein